MTFRHSLATSLEIILILDMDEERTHDKGDIQPRKMKMPHAKSPRLVIQQETELDDLERGGVEQ